MYSPYRLYAYCYAPGIGLPPYRGWPARPGRTVRGTVRSNPKRSYFDSFRLFWKSRGKSTRACGKNTRWLRLDLIEVSPGHFDPGPRGLVRAFRVVYRISQWGESCCRLQLFLCLVVENWIMWDGCSVFGAAQPLASPCQGEGDRRRRWKGGYVAESDIVTTGDMTYCFLYAAIERYATSPPPSHGFAVPAPLGKGGREV